MRGTVFFALLALPSLLVAQVDTIWVRCYDGSGNSYDAGCAVAVDGAGNVYVTGVSVGSGTGRDYCTIRYNSSGVQQWLQRYDGPSDGNDEAYALAVDRSGNAYVTGSSVGLGSSEDFCTIKYSPAGDAVWVRRYNGSHNADDHACGVVVDATGNVYVAGTSCDSVGGYNYCTVKYDSAGREQWVRRRDGPVHASDHPAAIALDGSANVYVTGISNTSALWDYCTVKYDSSGNEQWTRYYDSNANRSEGAAALAVDRYGNVVVTGWSYSSNSDVDYCTVKYSSAGDTVWVRRYTGPGGADYPRAVITDCCGSTYVTGYSRGSSGFDDYCTVKYDSSGNELWVRRSSGQGDFNVQSYAIALDRSGGAYVTGSVPSNYCTIKYDPDGDVVWVRYHGSSNSARPSAIATDSSGAVYVTGSADNDYCTLKYGQPDAAATAILAPTDSVDTSAVLIPVAKLRNFGLVPAVGVQAVFAIDTSEANGVYADTLTLTLAAGAESSLTFDTWPKPHYVRDYLTRCRVVAEDDCDNTNDTATGRFTVMAHVRDVACTKIVSPADSLDSGAVVTPTCSVYNYGNTTPASYNVRMRIGTYCQSMPVSSHAPGTPIRVTFPNWTAYPVGTLAVSCSTELDGDMQTGNDRLTGVVTVGRSLGPPPRVGWTARTPMPAGAKAIKDGGWLAYDASRARTFASRGNKQPDFFAYAPLGDSWSARAPWLPGTEGKLPQKGSAGCADGSGHVYATKGNNTRGFFTYDANANVWTQKKDVPLGLSNKKVKGGTDIVWALKGGVGSPYLLKGYKNEFYKYVVAGDSWLTLPPAPGAIPKWDKGSWLAYDGAHTIYAHKAKYHEFYKYDTEKDSWNPVALVAMPIPGSAGSKKSKDGGCGTYINVGIYALKGGNTQEFWKYTVSSNSWVERETIPRGTFKKKVKAGGDIVTAGTDLYAIKGNKSNELWMYSTGTVSEPPPPTREGVMASATGIREWGVEISPNPLTGGLVHLVVGGTSLSRPALVRLYDAAGRCVGVWKPLLQNGAADLDVRYLAAGVYLVKVETDDFTATQKLVVQR